ncbi:hypothetical protein Tco_0726192 [Tanacetum coccineum]|uniref:Uncharacterized protein n=1 Tax=Tanacetum coccineum TaxID=301880 RepID=A0ABQ4YFU8_9ASTR
MCRHLYNTEKTGTLETQRTTQHILDPFQVVDETHCTQREVSSAKHCLRQASEQQSQVSDYDESLNKEVKRQNNSTSSASLDIRGRAIAWSTQMRSGELKDVTITLLRKTLDRGGDKNFGVFLTRHIKFDVTMILNFNFRDTVNYVHFYWGEKSNLIWYVFKNFVVEEYAGRADSGRRVRVGGIEDGECGG